MPLEQTTVWEDGVVEGKSGYSRNRESIRHIGTPQQA